MPTKIRIKDPIFWIIGRILLIFLIIVVFAPETNIVIIINKSDNPNEYEKNIRIPSKILEELIALNITPINNGITHDIETKEYNIPYKKIPAYPFLFGAFLI